MTNPIQFTQHKDIRGHKIQKFTAQLGAVTAEGSTKDDAQTALVAILAAIRPFARSYYFAEDDRTVFTVNQDPTTNTWYYQIMDPGRNYPCSCMGFANEQECRDAARHHIESAFGGFAVSSRRETAGRAN